MTVAVVCECWNGKTTMTRFWKREEESSPGREKVAWPLFRRAFTLIELLVCITIIGVLVALLLPAVSMSRETARGLSCRNNLKQIGIALQMYDSSDGCFPPTFVTSASENATGSGASWSIHGRLMPYLDGGVAAERIDLDLDWHDQVDTGVTAMRIPVFLCPSESNDYYRTKNGKPYVSPHTYGFNFGTWMVYDPAENIGGDGAFTVNRGTISSEIADGLSTTLAVAEVKAYQSYIRNGDDPGEAVPNSPVDLAGLSGQMKLGPSITKNTGHTVWPDGRVHHSGFTTVFTPNTRVAYQYEGAEYDIDFTSQQEGKSDSRRTYAAITSRSYHPGSVNILLMDGSVRSVDDDVSPTVWRSLGTRGGGELVGEY